MSQPLFLLEDIQLGIVFFVRNWTSLTKDNVFIDVSRNYPTFKTPIKGYFRLEKMASFIVISEGFGESFYPM